jgi:hypothetical protein
MALVKCHECGSEVSTEAVACPKCGAPVRPHAAQATQAEASKEPRKPSWIVRVGGGFILLCVAIPGVAYLFLPDAQSPPQPPPVAKSAVQQEPEKAQPPKLSEAECRKDLHCWGEKGFVGASVYCPSKVEQLATHNVKWTDGFLEPKFSHYRWKDEEAGIVTFIGNRAEFQNGFGAYTPVIYECDYDNDHKLVLDVRAQEGRLP